MSFEAIVLLFILSFKYVLDAFDFDASGVDFLSVQELLCSAVAWRLRIVLYAISHRCIVIMILTCHTILEVGDVRTLETL